MRMTVDLPDTLFRELKVIAAHQGTSLKNIIRVAVEMEIRKAQHTTAHRVFPILRSSEPGTLKIMNADVEDILG